MRRRVPATYPQDGYMPGAETQVSVAMSIQEPNQSDYQANSESAIGGDRIRGLASAYTALADALTPSGRDGAPGDLVQHDGAWWLCVGASKLDVLIGTPVAHARHLLVRQPAQSVLFQALRPLDPLAPLANQLAGLRPEKVYEDYGDKYRTSERYGAPLSPLLLDATGLRLGDYLTSVGATWFIASLRPDTPPLCVACNATVTVSRPAGGLAPGLNSYGGRTDATDVVLLAGWPASVLEGNLTAGRTDLPGDARQGGMKLLLPALPGVVLEAGDLARDELGRRYVLTGCEHSTLGWRCTASLEAT